MLKNQSMRSAALDVSVILPFSDDEETIGRACGRIARHLRELGASFEILAVDEDSGDNSHAVIALVRGGVPELRVVAADPNNPDKGFAVGARLARGRVLWLVPPRAALSPLAPFARAWRRVVEGNCDLVLVHGLYAVCHRTRSLSIVDSAGSGPGYLRRLAQRAAARRLEVETHEAEPEAELSTASDPTHGEGRFSRFLGALGFGSTR